MQKKHTTLSHALWGTLVVVIGVSAGFVVTEGVAGAATLFQKIEVSHVAEQALTDEKVPADTTTTYSSPEDTLSAYYKINTSELTNIDAESFLVADSETGQIIVAKNDKQQLPIASITKLMTSVVSQEQLPTEEPTRISLSAIATEGWRGNLEVGQIITIKDLIAPLLLTSSNDAAEALAEAGGREQFISTMNAKAKEIGMDHTTFDDPSGLSSLNQSTTHDLFLLIRYIARNYPDILALTRTQHVTYDDDTWENTSRLLQQKSFRGGKTGYTHKAHYTSVGLYDASLAHNTSRNVVISILKSDQREEDIATILDYLEDNIFYGTTSQLNKVAQAS